MTASVSSHNHIFIGIDVGSASFEAAWHRGGCTQYQNRPHAIAAFVARLSAEEQIIRIAGEPPGGRADRRLRETTGQSSAWRGVAGRDGPHLALRRLSHPDRSEGQVRY